MKRLVLILILLLASSFLFANVIPRDVLWFWNNKADQNVQFFRYRTDGEEEWHVAQKEVFTVQFYYDDTVLHTFEIQQSYDGIHWSESVVKTYQLIDEDAEDNDVYVPNKYTVSMALSPFQTFILLNPHAGTDFYSVYSFGAEANATMYFNRVFGLGVKGQGTIGFKDSSFQSFAATANAYIEPSIRLIARKNFDLAVKFGLGVEAEVHREVVFFTPSACVQVDAGIPMKNGVSLMIAPSVSVSMNPFDSSVDYTSYIIRAITVGLEYRM